MFTHFFQGLFAGYINNVYLWLVKYNAALWCRASYTEEDTKTGTMSCAYLRQAESSDRNATRRKREYG